MSDEKSALRALEQLLLDLFRPEELRQWAFGSWPMNLAQHLPGEIASPMMLVIAAVRVLDRHALLDDRLFASLVAVRAWRAADIERVRVLFAAHPTASAALEVGAARSGRRFRQAKQMTHERAHAMRCRAEMIRRVRKVWIDDFLEPSLDELPWIELETSLRVDLVPYPGQLPLPTKNASLCETLQGAYDRSNGNLLLLGGPGAGKTVAMLSLARALITSAERDSSHPIPIILNLSSWVPDRQSLATWLIDEINNSYFIPRRAVQRWLDDDALVLFLDGLDEVRARLRDRCAEGINTFRRSHLCPVSVCIRTQSCLELNTRVACELAIELLPMTPMASSEILVRSSAAPVSRVESVTTPFMLKLLLRNRRSRRRADVTTNEAALDEYLDQAIACSTSSHVERRRMRTWLGFIAATMSATGVSELYVERMQPSWLPGKLLRLVYVGCSLVAICFAYSWTTAYLDWNPIPFPQEIWLPEPEERAEFERIAPSTPEQELIILIVGTLLWVPMGVAQVFRGRLLKIEVYEGLTWSWRAWGRRFAVLAGPAIIVSGLAAIGIYIRESTGQAFGIADVGYAMLSILGIGLVVGLLFGAIGGLVPEALPGAFVRHSWLFRTARHALLGMGVAVLPFVGALGLSMLAFCGGLREGYLFSAYLAFEIGSWTALLSFYLCGGDTLIQHYTLRWILGCLRILPMRLYSFLDRCVQAGILRRAGNGYMFMHYTMQEHLATEGKRRR